MPPELLTWGLPLVVALALFTLAYTLLPAATRSGDYWMAAIWFLAGVAILLLRFGYWGITSHRNLSLRIAICVIVVGGLSGITAQTFQSINHKRKALLAKAKTDTKSDPAEPFVLAKPDFKVDAPAALPGVVKLDVNMFKTVTKTTKKATKGLVFPVVVRFENLPKADAFPETDTVSAHIVYKETAFQNIELMRVDVGCWVDQPLPELAFPFRKARYLLLGGWNIVGKKPLKNEFKVFEYSRELHRATEKFGSMEAPRTLLVEVVLTSNEHPDVSQDYYFELTLLGPAPNPLPTGGVLHGRYSIRRLRRLS